MDFRNYIRHTLLKKNDRVLEFGPLHRPIASKEITPNTFFADIRSTEDIKQLYTSNEYLKSTGLTVDINEIVDIDYVVKDSYKETFKGVEKFDSIILAHVIEHMPDIIEFFTDIKNILKKNGHLILIYPDAQYCFDHFRNGTSFIDAYEVYINKPNASKRVFDFVYNVVAENNPGYYWEDVTHEDKLPVNSFEKAVGAYNDAKLDKLPDDTHFWPFSDYQFIKFLYDMDRAGMLGFSVEAFYETEHNTQEFMVVLKNTPSKDKSGKTYKEMLNNLCNRNKLAHLKAKSEKLQAELSVERAEKGRLQRELSDIYSSRKWKYTQKVVRAIRGVKKKSNLS